MTKLDSGLDWRDGSLLVDYYGIDVIGALDTINLVMDKKFKKKGGAILVTGGRLILRPMYVFPPLSTDKAAFCAMCLALHNEYQGREVFVGTVTVTGTMAPGKGCDPDLVA